MLQYICYDGLASLLIIIFGLLTSGYLWSGCCGGGGVWCYFDDGL